MTPADRIAAVWALLRSFADWLPSPQTATGQLVRRAAQPGEYATDFVDCRSCGGRGLVRRSGSDVACRTCSGSGLRAVDAYTRREVEAEPAGDAYRVPTSAELVRAIRYRRIGCDGCGGSGRVSASARLEPGLRDLLERDGDHHWWRQAERERCPHCRGSGSLEVVDERLTDASLRRIASDQAARAGAAGSGDWLDSALEERRRQWASGSYAELELALRRLELKAPRLHAALMRHVVYEPGEYVVSDTLRARLEAAAAWLAAELRGPIRVPAAAKAAASRKAVLWRHRSAAAEHERRKRNSEIAALVLDHSVPPERVAEIHAVSPRRVRQIAASAASVELREPDAVATFAL